MVPATRRARGDAVAIDTLEPMPTKARAARSFPISTTLALWAALVVLLNLVLWIGGLRGFALSEAIERGAARAERAGIGEMGDQAIRDAVRIQQETYSFWAALVALDDFAVEPLVPTARALTVATIFAGLAALVGRPVLFPEALAACARAQGWWVLGLALRVALMVALKRTEAETSAVLLLPAGRHPATTWIALRQLDLFAAIGWGTMALGGWRRGQVHLAAAVLVCAVLWLGESVVRVAFALLFGAGMRLTVLG
jgi:hypothetical protein